MLVLSIIFILKLSNFYVCAQFDKRNGSTRAEVVHDAIQVANIADLVSTIL